MITIKKEKVGYYMAVENMIYLALITGVILSQFSLIKKILTGIMGKVYLRQDLKSITDNEEFRKYGRALAHIKMLMEITGTTAMVGKPEHFIVVSICLFGGMLFSISWVEGFAFAFIIAAAVGMMPYMLMRSKLNDIRVRSSREGDVMVSELLKNYKKCDFDIKGAIEITAESIEDAPYSKHLLSKLAMALDSSYTKEDMRNSLYAFKYAIDTSWGDALSTAIYFSKVKGADVTEALEDIKISLVISRQLLEQERRENSETWIILRCFVPISYLLSIFCACRYFGFTPGKFVHYQLGTALGFKWFMITAVLFAAGLITSRSLAKDKMDILR